MSDIILRKVDASESYFINSNDLTHVSRLFKIESQIDYYKHLELMNESIQKWILIHPFLSAKFSIIDSDYYLVKTEKDDQLKNVKFLTIDSEKLEDDYNKIIDLLVENETATKLSNNEKLWRLTFIKQSNKNNSFDVIFSIHHTITEGRNVCYIFLQLLNMFEDDTFDLKPHSVLPSMEDLFLKKFNKQNESMIPIASIKKPSFINEEKAKSISIEQTIIKYEKISDVHIHFADNETSLVNIKDLIEIAKFNQMKFKFIEFTKEDSLKLVKVLKQKKVKMQPFLSVLFTMGFKKVYDELGDESEKNHRVVYGHTVSLRQFENDLTLFGQNLNDNIGFFATAFNYESNAGTITLDNFWSLVEKENAIIQEKLEAGEQFKNPNYLDFDPGNFFFDFEMSNLGIVQSSFSDKSLHKIKSCFLSVRSESPIRISFNNLITVDNILFWSFMYNSFYIEHKIAELIVQRIQEILFKLILF